CEPVQVDDFDDLVVEREQAGDVWRKLAGRREHFSRSEFALAGDRDGGPLEVFVKAAIRDEIKAALRRVRANDDLRNIEHGYDLAATHEDAGEQVRRVREGLEFVGTREFRHFGRRQREALLPERE